MVPRVVLGGVVGAVLGGALGVGLLLAAGFAGARLRRQILPPPRFQLLNFPVGTLETARFGADGRTIYCSLRVGGGHPELFSFDPRDTEPKALGLHDALLLAVSPTNELALLQSPTQVSEGRYVGTLSQTAGDGGGRRLVREGVTEAVWDGSGFALVIEFGIRDRLEFPAGKTVAVWESTSRTLNHLALSKDGSLLACVESDDVAQTTRVVAFRRDGGRRVLYAREGEGSVRLFTGLVWGPGGELWVSETEGDQTVVWTLSLAGTRRIRWRGQGNLQLMDLSREGRALLVQQTVRRSVWSVNTPGGAPVDLSVQGRTQLEGLSDDGRLVLLDESPITEGTTLEDRCYVRSTAGGPPRLLGKGFGEPLTGDGKWVQMDPGPQPAEALVPAWAQALEKAGLAPQDLGSTKARIAYRLFVPTGPELPFSVVLPKGRENDNIIAYLLPDERRVLTLYQVDGSMAWVILDRGGAPPVQVTPPGFDWVPVGSLSPLAPDGTGRFIGCRDTMAWFILSLAGGRPEPIRGLHPGERPVGWSTDGGSVFVRNPRDQLPVTITRLDLRSEARKVVTSFSPLDPAGFLECRDAYASTDGRTFAFSLQKRLSDLYLVDNLADGP